MGVTLNSKALGKHESDRAYKPGNLMRDCQIKIYYFHVLRDVGNGHRRCCFRSKMKNQRERQKNPLIKYSTYLENTLLN